jgi:hypothetical protein
MKITRLDNRASGVVREMGALGEGPEVMFSVLASPPPALPPELCSDQETEFEVDMPSPGSSFRFVATMRLSERKYRFSLNDLAVWEFIASSIAPAQSP